MSLRARVPVSESGFQMAAPPAQFASHITGPLAAPQRAHQSESAAPAPAPAASQSESAAGRITRSDTASPPSESAMPAPCASVRVVLAQHRGHKSDSESAAPRPAPCDSSLPRR